MGKLYFLVPSSVCLLLWVSSAAAEKPLPHGQIFNSGKSLCAYMLLGVPSGEIDLLDLLLNNKRKKRPTPNSLKHPDHAPISAEIKISFEDILSSVAPVFSAEQFYLRISDPILTHVQYFFQEHLHQLSAQQLESAFRVISDKTIRTLIHERLLAIYHLSYEVHILREWEDHLDQLEADFLQDEESVQPVEPFDPRFLSFKPSHPWIESWDYYSLMVITQKKRVDLAKFQLTKGYQHPQPALSSEDAGPQSKGVREVAFAKKQSGLIPVNDAELKSAFPALASKKIATYDQLIGSSWSEPIFYVRVIENLLNRGRKLHIEQFFHLHLHQLSLSQIHYLLKRDLARWINDLLEDRLDEFAWALEIQHEIESFQQQADLIQDQLLYRARMSPQDFKELLDDLKKKAPSSDQFLDVFQNYFIELLARIQFRLDEAQLLQIAQEVYEILLEIGCTADSFIYPLIEALRQYSRSILTPHEATQHYFARTLGRSLETLGTWGATQESLMRNQDWMTQQSFRLERELLYLKQRLSSGRLK